MRFAEAGWAAYSAKHRGDYNNRLSASPVFAGKGVFDWALFLRLWAQHSLLIGYGTGK